MTRQWFLPVSVALCAVCAAVADAGADPIHEAAMLGDLAEVDRLLANGTPVDARDQGGTPLQWAAFANQTYTADFLLMRGADPNAEGAIGMPLQRAAQFGNETLVARLIRHGADPNRGGGPRPLAIAARGRHAGIVGLLLASGADQSAATDTGMTPLHEAAWAGSLEITRALVTAGADIRALTVGGKAPISYALERGHQDIGAFLRAEGWAPHGVAPVATLLAAADVAKGRAEFASCGGCCHSENGANGIGPSLRNVIGRPIAEVHGFDYSPAFASLEGAWSYEALNQFLARPAEFAPGTSMNVVGIDDPSRRANLIAYLRTLSDHPLPLPDPE